ncbi:MAG: isomerase, partial [Gammaproteobacteria bacterium]
MNLKIYQIDAFANRTFEGNPAAVCPLNEWISDTLLQQIAAENNLSETAFFVTEGNGFALRWFTPESEVDLCGHATLAAAHVIFKHLGYTNESLLLNTKSGTLKVGRSDSGYSMSFPASHLEPVDTPVRLKEALGITPIKTLAAFDYIVIVESQAQVQALSPDFATLQTLDLRGVVV